MVVRRLALTVLTILALAMPTRVISGPRPQPGPIDGALPASGRPARTTENVLYPFGGGADGIAPVASVILDRAGALYGTTQYGGSKGLGTVFKLTPVAGGYAETILYSFQGGSDGAYPVAGLMADDSGALFGTTRSGGGCANARNSEGCGTVFTLTPATPGTGYRERVLYAFKGGNSDGMYPLGSLIRDAQGSLYGTTSQGGKGAAHVGIDGYGTIFQLKRSGTAYTEHVLYMFASGSDGANPVDGDGLLFDAAGSLYGTTEYGGGGYDTCGLGCGTIFALRPLGNGYSQRILHVFVPGAGVFPTASLIGDKTGTLYGSTLAGGMSGLGQWGVVFTLLPTGAYRVVFSGLEDFTSGTRLIENAAGALYGTSANGGYCRFAKTSCGIVFKLTPVIGGGYNSGVVYRFAGNTDGAFPGAGLSADRRGKLYGTTTRGGDAWACTNGCGTVFELVP